MRAATLACAVALASACGAPMPAGGQAGAGAGLPTPQTALSPPLAATAAALRAHLGARYPLTHLPGAYRPSEPESLRAIPRAVFQMDLGTPGENYVVTYELVDSAMAAARGQELAAYLASGFGQTNYPSDAQFVLSQYGNTLVFGWWSPERATSRAELRAAFELLRGFGQPIAVPK